MQIRSVKGRFVSFAVHTSPKASCGHCSWGVGAGPLRTTLHPRARGFRPGLISTAMGGSALGPAIPLDSLRWRLAIRVATSTTVESLALQWFRCGDPAGLPRSWSIIRRHSCAWQAVSDSQARSSGNSSRPSGVIRRLPRKAKPAQGPVSSVRLYGSNSITLPARPCRGSDQGGKSRARGPAIAMRRRRTPQLGPSTISHNVYYVQERPERGQQAPDRLRTNDAL